MCWSCPYTTMWILQIHHQIESNLIVICRGDGCRFYLKIWYHELSKCKISWRGKHLCFSKKLKTFIPKFRFTINVEVPIHKVALQLVPKGTWIHLLPFNFGLLPSSCTSFWLFTKQHSWILYCLILLFTLTFNSV